MNSIFFLSSKEIRQPSASTTMRVITPGPVQNAVYNIIVSAR